MVEETTAATNNLKGETDKLTALMMRFEVDGETGHPVGRPAPKASPRRSVKQLRVVAGGAAKAQEATQSSWKDF